MRHAIGPYEDLITTGTKTQIEMALSHKKINRTCEDDPREHGTKAEKERQIGKRWEDNISKWTGLGLGEAL